MKNREIFDKKEIAETFNSYFVNIGPNLAASIPQSKTSFENYIHYNGPCLSTINLTDLELENAFASLKTNKSLGYDDISADVVKRNNSLVTNYRPISVLPCFSKLLERIMYNRLYKFLLENNIFIKSNLDFKMHIQQNMLLFN